MAVKYQLVINCVGDPERLARFWAEALGYVLEPPPADFATWDDWRRDIGLPESWLGRGTDCIIDPEGAGPRVWIQVVPDPKTTSNRLHIDVHAVVQSSAQVTEQRGAEITQPQGLGVHPILANRDR